MHVGALASSSLPLNEERREYYMVRDGVRCAGAHILLDLHGADPASLRDSALIEEAFRRCVEASGATLLHIHTHEFEENGGISGVAVLAESHISIHTWPESGFAALDVFMCGNTAPEACIPILRDAFKASRAVISEQLRGKGV